MKTPTDYDKEDGWNAERGLEQCPHCEQFYSGNGGYVGPVFDQQGREFEYYVDTDPNKGPFFCVDCWDELETNLRQQENAGLDQFA